MGTVMMGYFYRGARDVTIGYDGPCASLQDLRQAGSETYEALMTKHREAAEAAAIEKAPWWKRWWLRRNRKYAGNRS